MQKSGTVLDIARTSSKNVQVWYSTYHKEPQIDIKGSYVSTERFQPPITKVPYLYQGHHSYIKSYRSSSIFNLS
jgi:hypothetical protein